ncbi:hypothetical protein ACKLNR_013882 [Fusarium oxysporum f. sp. zingiberi]
MSMSIYAKACGHTPEPELEETVTDLPVRIIFIHGLNSPCTSVCGRYDDSEAVGLKPIKSPFELPQATTAYTFYHGGNLLEDVNSIPKAAEALRAALCSKGTGYSCNSSNNQSHKRNILVCHGSGGFIVKEAFLGSLNGSDREQAFHQSIIGVVFVGTPHSTADEKLPHQLYLMRNLRSHDSPSVSMNTIASVKILLRGFNSLDWSHLGFKSVSFFEEVGSPGAPEDFGPIVNCEDVHIEGQKQIGLHADHWVSLSNLEIWLDQPGAQREDRLGYIDFPKDLKDLYSSIISRIESSERNRDIVRHIFQWVAFATRPLTVPELMNAMAFEKVADYDLCFHDNHQALDAMSHLNSDICECAKRITSPCRGFIAIQSPITASRQSVVSFTHQTVFDFLMACEPLVLQPGTMQCRGHEALAWSCCQIILSETRSRRKGYIESCSGTRQISSYALESWMPHLRKALELGSSCSKLLSDLSQKDFLENSLALGESVASSYKQWPRLAHKSAIGMSWKANRWKPSSPLLLTSAVGHVGSCQRYISMGESYNDRDSLYGISPLGWAAAYGHSEVVELLLDSGAEADHTPNDTSPLRLAVRCGNKRVTQLLLERRPAINYEPTVIAQSALSLAASLGRASMITLLVSCGANALTVDDLGWNSLHHAIIAGKRATLAQLLSTIPKASFEKLKDLPPRNLPGWVHRVLLAFGLGLCCHGSGGSSSSATNCGSNDSGKVRKRGRQGSKKRGRDSTEDIDRNDEQSMAPPPQKQSRNTFGLRFACPYNKRCPNRFGGACSNFGFPDMHRLKEHLFRRHFLGCDKRTRCGRCKLIFPESEIQDHLILEMACEPMRVALNYEDGFDTNQSDTLKSLKPKQFETPVHHWEKTFNTVFPDWTTDLPSPYHETTETECRINVAARLRSEEFRQEVWRNFNDMGREVFEQLANLLDPWPSASNRPGNQPPSLPDELPMRPAAIQENVQTALNPSVESCLPTVPQRGTAASETRAAAPTLNSSAQRYRPIPPHFFFPNQQISDTLSLSLFSGTGSLNSFGPGQESMYGDMDANNASMSSWDCSFANTRMEQTSNDPFEFTVNTPAPANNHESSRYENQPNHDTDLVTAADNQPPSMEEAANTLWAPARNSD